MEGQNMFEVAEHEDEDSCLSLASSIIENEYFEKLDAGVCLNDDELFEIQRLLVQECPRLTDRHSRVAVRRLFAGLVRFPHSRKWFSESFVPSILQLVSQSCRKSKLNDSAVAAPTRFVLWDWLYHWLYLCMDDAHEMKAAIFNGICSLVDSFSHSNKSIFSSARRQLSVLLKKYPELPKKLLCFILEKEVRENHIMVLDVIVDTCSTGPVLQFYMTPLIRVYTEIVLNGSFMSQYHCASVLCSLMPNINAEQLTTELAPAFDRALRRQPEYALGACICAVGHLVVSLDSVMLEFILKPALILLKGSSAENRENALSLLSSASKLLSNSAVEKCIEEMSNEIPKLASWEHRQIYVRAIGTFCQQKNTKISSMLIDLMTKEKTDAVLYTIADVIVLWDVEVNDVFMKFLQAGLSQDKMKSIYIYLLFLLGKQVWQHITPEIITLLEKSIGVASVEGWQVLCILSADHDRHRARLIAGTSPKSLLFGEKLIMKSMNEKRETEIFLKAAEIILGQLSHVASLECQQALIKGFLQVFQLSDWKLARQASKIYRSLLANTSGLFHKTVDTLYLLLNDWHSRQYQPPTPFTQCIVSLARYSNVLPLDRMLSQFGQLIVIAHHPYFVSTHWNWKTLCENAKKHCETSFTWDDLIERQLDTMLGIIYSEHGLDSKYEVDRDAAIKAIQTLSRVHSHRTIPTIMSTVLENLAAEQYRSIDENSMLIWRTVENTLAIKPSEEDIRATDKSGRVGASSTSDKKLKTDGLKKKSELGHPREEENRLKAQLENEKQVRQHVELLHQKAQRASRILTALIESSPSSIHDFVYDILSTVLPNAQNLLTSVFASEIYMSLAQCVSSRIQPIGRALPALFFRLVNPSVAPKDWQTEDLHLMVKRVLKVIDVACEFDALPTGTFSFIFPLLSHIIYSRDLPEQDTACKIILAHCDEQLLPDVAPCDEMLVLLFHMMSVFPKFQKAASESLIVICSALEDIDALTVDNARVLLKHTVYSQTALRKAALECLAVVTCPDELEEEYRCVLFLAQYDVDAEVRDIAKTVWEQEQHPVVDQKTTAFLTSSLAHPAEHVRLAASKGLAALLSLQPATNESLLTSIFSLYEEAHRQGTPLFDDFGRLLTQTTGDPVHVRRAVAHFLQETATITLADSEKYLLLFFDFLTAHGLRDRSPAVRSAMMEAGQVVLANHGAAHVQLLLPLFDQLLSTPSKLTLSVHKLLADQQRASDDAMRQAVIVLTGAVARFLSPQDDKMKKILASMLLNRNTPNAEVQMALGECIAPLVKCLSTDELKTTVDELMQSLMTGEKYAERRGAAYALSGVIKGKGIAALKDFSLMARLKEAMDGKDTRRREGALFAYGALSLSLGRLFEPYILQILPLLLAAFSDNSIEVREAAGEAAKVMMARLSGHCVKLILPTLLQGLASDQQWRTQLGSVEMLGAMSHCAPAQLSQCLPTIVPRLSDILLDAHVKVQAAGKEALRSVGAVIKNPEIQVIVPTLLDALCDPQPRTQEAALKILLATEFVHVIDAASLALVLPILHRALKERSTETKKRAAQIVSNMCSLTDTKDLVSYVPSLLPGVREIVLDPVPEVRTMAAKALGTLVRKLGESHFSELLPWLMSTLCAETTSVDRSGAAQGLAEVLSALGGARVRQVLPELLTMAVASHARPSVREGAMSALMYLPSAFSDQAEDFQPFLPLMVPAVLKGLADENEGVREVAMRAGHRMIHQYATTAAATDLLLPALQESVFEANWRIRQTSLQLLGLLLSRMAAGARPAGSTAVTTSEPLLTAEEAVEAGRTSDDANAALMRVLGSERCHGMLSTLYLARQDVNALVRQTALQVWKSVVQNTPRTVKDILPAMMPLLVRLLASDIDDCQHMAAHTLGELVRKLGERLMTDLLPLMQARLAPHQDAVTRRGVCIGLREIISATAQQHHLMLVMQGLSSALRVALCDTDADVRACAAAALDEWHRCIGDKALDAVVPYLLSQLTTLESDSVERNGVVDGLKDLLALKSHALLPLVLPSLCRRDAPQMAVLAVLLPVTDSQALGRHVGRLIEGFVVCFEELTTAIALSAPTVEAIKACVQVMAAEEKPLELLVSQLRELLLLEDDTKSDRVVAQRRCALYMLHVLGANAKYGVLTWMEKLLSDVIGALGSTDEVTVVLALMALDALVKSMRKEEQPAMVTCVRRAIRALDSSATARLQSSSGISAILPVYLQALMLGDAAEREMSALAICDLLHRSLEGALRPFAIQLTGPLIRVMGDRFPWQVKAAILRALSLMLQKLGVSLKPFLPQLQTIFLRSLHDTQLYVRVHAAEAIGQLVVLQTRLELLVSELVTQMRDASTKETYLQALLQVVVGAPQHLSETSVSLIYTTLSESEIIGRDSREQELCLAILARIVMLLPNKSAVLQSWAQDKRYVLGNVYLMHLFPGVFSQEQIQGSLRTLVLEGVREKKNVEGCLLLAEKLLVALESERALQNALVEALSQCLQADVDAQLKRRALTVLIRLAKSTAVRPVLAGSGAVLLPPLMGCLKERVMPVKLAAERALVAIFALKEGVSQLEQACRGVDATLCKNLLDYASRVLSRVATVRGATEAEKGQEEEEEEDDDDERVLHYLVPQMISVEDRDPLNVVG